MSTKAAPPANSDDLSLQDLIIDCIQDIKGKSIVKLDMTELDTAPASTFIICEGESTTQVRAISQNISRRLKAERGIMPNHSEGLTDSKWILVDYFDVLVHIFYPETRTFYDLENLWSDAKRTVYEDI